MEQSHCNTPVSDGALRILAGDVPELLLRFLVSKRMQQRDAALELLLDLGDAGDGK